MSNTDRTARSITQQNNARTLSGFNARNPCAKLVTQGTPSSTIVAMKDYQGPCCRPLVADIVATTPTPVIPPISGSLVYSFIYTGSDPLTDELVALYYPIIESPNVFSIVSSNISIVGSTVTVTLVTSLAATATTAGAFGLSFDTLSLQSFYNDQTSDVTLISENKVPFSSVGSQFNGLLQLTILTSFVPYFLPGTSLTSCFNFSTNFNSDISLWDTTNVTDMSAMFNIASAFNQDISGWNVSNVTDMNNMFNAATAFNNGGASLANWSAPLCTSFSNMFSGATVFNQPLTNLASSGTGVGCGMSSMFVGATNFNQNIGGWDVSKVLDMSRMFQSATAFNNGGASLATWSAPLCTSFTSMFQSASSFNQPLTNLASSGTGANCTMLQMFQSASAFNNGLASGVAGTLNWNTSNVTFMSNVFQSASAFNQDVSGWDVSNVTGLQSMFRSATVFNNGGVSLANWSAPLCTQFQLMFQSATAFNQPLTNLVNTSGVASCTMNNMFLGATNFNQNIGSWNTSNVTTMASMFEGTTSLSTTTRFNNGQSGLTTITGVTPATSSYVNGTKTLTCPGATFLTSLVVGDVLIIQTATIVYSSAIQSITDNTNLILTTAFGSNIAVGTITAINKQVAGTAPLNWDTSKVTTIFQMFRYCIFFNQNITTTGSIWNTNLVTTVASLFAGATTSLITFFNNGQIITGTSAPMGWTFNVVPASGAYRTNCRLTTSNKPASLA